MGSHSLVFSGRNKGIVKMAVLLSLKKLDNEVEDKNIEIENTTNEPEKYSLDSVKTYFRNLIRTNSYTVGKSGKRKSPLPDIVKEFFTLKNVDEIETEADEESFKSPNDGTENLLDEHDGDDYSKSLDSVNSFTNLRLRLMYDSLEKAEERLDDLVASIEENKLSNGDNSYRSFTFSCDEDSIDEGCFGRLHLEESEKGSEEEFEILLSEDENEVAEDNSFNDVVINHLGEDQEEVKTSGVNPDM